MRDFAIAGARVFDGERSLGVTDVRVHDNTIAAVGGPLPPDIEVIDGTGATLLPGLIDAHVHASEESLRQALAFGVTTELDLLSMPRIWPTSAAPRSGSRRPEATRTSSAGPRGTRRGRPRPRRTRSPPSSTAASARARTT
jgi:hypothetical protein